MLRTAIPASHLPHSGIREIVDLALGSSSPMIRLEIGEPDFPTPAHVIDAAFEAARKKTSYVQTAGIPVLREAITDRLEADYGVRAPIERVLISHGAVQAVDAVMAAVVAAGDEVLIPDPAWPNYEMQATLLGATPVHYGLRPDDAFQPDIAEIRALVTPRTRVIVINSPSNPTGAVMPAETVAAIVEFAVSRDILVISDEVYDEMVFDGGHTTAAALAPHNVVSVFSFSKTYAMTGWRVGYALVPGWLADTVVRILELQSSCVSSVTQAAALAAITGPQKIVAEMRDAYRRRRDLAGGILAGAGIEIVRPHGAFYLMLPLPGDIDARAAALELVAHGVSFAPGTAFGRQVPHHLRVSLAAADATIREGLARFLAWREAHLALPAGSGLTARGV
ncbi:aminotransferase class I/II-fold pyridoxal phosphate-dependent enzyme [Microbacterium sp. ET2]|uniref:pyridoxal phosphate-dependent aminotransferase n=1 Tax=Microbacterium albipurpureum TaxID=3050384 RepID=UPI00259D26B9|nr:aminotransferase class I/II-fold pyridoxal phosphate-dependent enzyme [Microbacterium sp. ET2 (Ac-2212)]WJL96360.1 aminotransferase class I/II-fold pyridoxal phosphate-dependent enzyme [Microbacterium sp. ET2 (Ac-2212)]